MKQWMLRRATRLLAVLLLVQVAVAAVGQPPQVEPVPEVSPVLGLEVPDTGYEVPDAGYTEGAPRFIITGDADEESRILTFGSNSFSPQQLVGFVLSLGEFIETSAQLQTGQSLVLQQDGVTGYMAISAYNTGIDLVFMFTLHAEPPAEVAGIAAVQGLAIDLADQLLY